jgi:uncharacterized repeat protein (TIGR01451 family)
MKATSSRKIMHAKLVLMVAAVAVVGISLEHLTYAASGSLTFSPSSGSYSVGSTFTVAVQENSGPDPANTVDAVVTFPASLQFVSDTTVGPFSFNPVSSDTASGNSVHITRAQLGTSSTGAQTLTTITFKVVSAGSAAVGFGTGSDILSATNSSNLLTNSPGATYTLSTPVNPPPPPSPTPTPAPTPAAPASSGNSKGTSISVKGSGSAAASSGGSAVTVPNNGSVAVNTPVSVEPATIQSDGVTKVEYYLGGKLVDTETKPPYKFNINTAKLKNGSYNLASKTYYTNGTTKQATQHLIVRNAAARTKSSLWLYFLVIGVVILIVLGINFIGPSTGDPFRRLFKRYTLPPLSPDAGGSGPVVGSGSGGSRINTGPLAAVPPVSGAAPTVATPGISIAPGSSPASQPVNTPINRLQPAAHPQPGTVFSPSKDS